MRRRDMVAAVALWASRQDEIESADVVAAFGVTREYAQQILHRLVSTNRINRIRTGVYRPKEQ